MGTPRPVREGSKWRMKIQARDGNPHSVHVQLPDRRELNDSYCRYVAQQLFVALEDLDAVLNNWEADALRQHLEKQDPADVRARVFSMRGSSAS